MRGRKTSGALGPGSGSPGQDAHHRVGVAVQGQRPIPGSRSSAAEAALPEAVGEDGHTVVVAELVVGEVPAHGRVLVPGAAGGWGRCGRRVTSSGWPVPSCSGRPVENGQRPRGSGPGLPVPHVWRDPRRCRIHPSSGLADVRGHELGRVVIGQGSEHEPVHHGEHRGVGPDAQRQRQGHRGREDRPPSQGAHRVAESHPSVPSISLPLPFSDVRPAASIRAAAPWISASATAPAQQRSRPRRAVAFSVATEERHEGILHVAPVPFPPLPRVDTQESPVAPSRPLLRLPGHARPRSPRTSLARATRTKDAMRSTSSWRARRPARVMA